MRKGITKSELQGDIVGPLHVNEFYFESTFISPVGS